METHELRKYLKLRQPKFADMARVAAFVLGLAMFGYVGVTLLQHAGPSLTAASRFMPESQMVNLESSTDSVDAQGTSGTATAAVPAASTPRPVTRNFDYFPDHYVNQATTNEEPVATF